MLILLLIILAIATGVAGAVVKGLFWLLFVAVALLALAAVVRMIGNDER